ncbi:MAG: helix-turn-helix domain-containing protein [Nitrospirota bacterium]
MTLGERIAAWRVARRVTPDELATRAGIVPERLTAVEQGDTDASSADIETLAAALGIPPGWLYDDPKRLLALIETDSEPCAEPDPVTARMLAAAGTEREIFTLLTQLVWAGEPRLIRAAEVSLRSLVKQIPKTTVPWESRPPGHFEPPAD